MIHTSLLWLCKTSCSNANLVHIHDKSSEVYRRGQESLLNMVDAKKSVSLHVPLYLQSSFSRGVFKNILWHFNFLWLTYQFQSFPNLENQSLLKSYYFAGAITFQSFPNFLNPSESCRDEVVFVQRHNASLHSKLLETALKLTPNYWHLTRTVYRYSLILRSCRAKPKLIEDNANRFMKALH